MRYFRNTEGFFLLTTGLSYKRNTSKFYSAIRSGIPSQNQNLLVPQE